MTDEATMTEAADTIDELKARLDAALDAQHAAEGMLLEKEEALAEAEELIARYKPTVEVSSFLMESEDDVRARFSKQHLKDIAASQLAEVNRHRLKNGLLPVDYTEKQWEDAIDEAVADLLGDKDREGPAVTGPLLRTLKMVKENKDGTMRLVQIPYEDQINNLAGSLADGKVKYTDKGFKLTDPMLCPSQNCYNPASEDASGRYLYAGYCSQDHYNRTEREQAKPVENVTNRNALRG